MVRASRLAPGSAWGFGCVVLVTFAAGSVALAQGADPVGAMPQRATVSPAVPNPVAAVPGCAVSSHVRPSDRRAARLLGRASASSPTVAQFLQALASTDILVTVQVTLARFVPVGDFRFLAVAGGCRYAAVRVSADQSPWDQIAVLGHELQHAMEVAGEERVRDQVTLAELMRRIGRQTGAHTYETDHAARITQQVRLELNRR